MSDRILVLLRHGQSELKHQNRLSGWADAPLTDEGREAARNAGRVLLEAGYDFDVGVASVLRRSVRTLRLALDEMGFRWIPVVRDWRLNERHWGALEGLTRTEAAERFGEEQVRRWSRNLGERPPALAPDDPRHPDFDLRYAHLSRGEVPGAESLADTFERVSRCWEETIAPHLLMGSRLLVCAHRDSLRALVNFLDEVGEDDVADYEFPAGFPLVYRLDERLRVAARHTPGGPKAAWA
jgi:2,3-bisphosphoglycerate-dependent phosphoglycerate mutase